METEQIEKQLVASRQEGAGVMSGVRRHDHDRFWSEGTGIGRPLQQALRAAQGTPIGQTTSRD